MNKNICIEVISYVFKGVKINLLKNKYYIIPWRTCWTHSRTAKCLPQSYVLSYEFSESSPFEDTRSYCVVRTAVDICRGHLEVATTARTQLGRYVHIVHSQATTTWWATTSCLSLSSSRLASLSIALEQFRSDRHADIPEVEHLCIPRLSTLAHTLIITRLVPLAALAINYNSLYLYIIKKNEINNI